MVSVNERTTKRSSRRRESDAQPATGYARNPDSGNRPIAARGLEPINPKDPNVVPIAWSAFVSTLPSDADSARARSVLLNANKYAVTTWYNTSKNFDAQSGTYLDFGGTGETAIRPSASQAISLAISLKLNAYSSTATGVSEASAKAITLKLVRSLAYRHLSNTSGGWGNEWQSALWAHYAGTAGWLMWADLSATDREYVRKMVEYEANRFIGYQTPYYRNTGGTILTPGDSKAEENSWNAMVLQLATSMMPAHPNYRAWLHKEVELMMSAFARPADLGSTTSYNGAPFSWWLNGSNAENDHMVVNHSRIHPDYTMTVTQNLNAILVAAMAGVPAPQAARANTAGTYDALVDLSFTAGASYAGTNTSIYSPGGSIFIRNSANLYFPQGNDWGTNRRMNSALMDAMARAFGLDGAASVKATVWEPLHMQRVLDDQSRGTDGRTYQAAGEDTYAGREEWVAALAARAWWTKWVAAKGAGSTSNAAIATVVDNKDRGFSVLGGTWAANTSGADKLGTGFRSIAPGSGANKVRFSFAIPVAGSYKVYAWWPAASSHASNARYKITYGGTSAYVTMDQRANGGRFNLLGTYNFSAGAEQSVELDDLANGTVAADAILFMPADAL